MTVARITGAARGIGRAIALRLAKDGRDIAASDAPLNASRARVHTHGGRGPRRQAIALAGDVTKLADVRHIVSETAAQLGSLDIMVANAGVAQTKALLDVSPEEDTGCTRSMGAGSSSASRAPVASSSELARSPATRASAARGLLLFPVWRPRALTQAAAQEWDQHGITERLLSRHHRLRGSCRRGLAPAHSSGGRWSAAPGLRRPAAAGRSSRAIRPGAPGRDSGRRSTPSQALVAAMTPLTPCTVQVTRKGIRADWSASTPIDRLMLGAW
jgi:hypothetical protein